MVIRRVRRAFLPLLGGATLLLLGACTDNRQPSGDVAEDTASDPATDAATRQAIEAAMAESAAGWNAGDIGRFMAVYSDSPETSFVAGQELLRGKPAMIAMYEQAYDFADAAKRGTLSFETLDLRALGSAHVLYIARYTLTYPAAEPVTGLTSVVFARKAGGWRIKPSKAGRIGYLPPEGEGRGGGRS